MEKQVPSVSQYVAAFQKIRPQMNDKQFELLKKHYAAPARAMTAGKLAQSVGWQDHRGANRWYGGLGRMLADAMGFEYGPESGIAVSMLALFVEPESVSNAEWLLVMRANVAEALEVLGWVDKASHLFMPPGSEANPPDFEAA